MDEARKAGVARAGGPRACGELAGTGRSDCSMILGGEEDVVDEGDTAPDAIWREKAARRTNHIAETLFLLGIK